MEWLKRCICGRTIRPIFTPSFFKVNCSFQWCLSMCERRVFSTDYLPMSMIKVTEHLCMFTSAACTSVLVCFCVLLLDRHVHAYVLQMFCKMLPFHSKCVMTFLLHTFLSNLCLTFSDPQTQKIFVKIVTRTLAFAWRKTAAEPSSYRKYVNMGNMTFKAALIALTVALSEFVVCSECVQLKDVQ